MDNYLSKFTAIDRSPAPPPSNRTALLIDFGSLDLFLVNPALPNCRASAERRSMGEQKILTLMSPLVEG